MGDMATFLQGLATVFQPMSVFSVFLGALLGVAVGVMPGLSSVMGMSIMLPLALQMKGTAVMLLMSMIKDPDVKPSSRILSTGMTIRKSCQYAKA